MKISFKFCKKVLFFKNQIFINKFNFDLYFNRLIKRNLNFYTVVFQTKTTI